MRILVVEDEPRVADFIRRGLVEDGNEVDVVRNGEKAIARAGSVRYDVVVLDVGLPGQDGFEVAASLRRSGTKPILMLTARDAPEDIVRGLNAGADDYLRKPFDFAELVARLRALERRATSETAIQAGDITVDRIRHEVRRGDVPLRLTPVEYRLLETIMRASGAIVGRAELLDRVWGMTFDPGTSLIDVHIANLRQKLEGNGGPRVIVTVKGVGFRFAAPER